MALSDIMRKAESSLNSITLKRSQRRGWQPLIVGYTGYGTTDQVRIFGRVLMHDPDAVSYTHLTLPTIYSV